MIEGTTVYEAFEATVGAYPARPILCVTPSTASAYGIEASEITYDETHGFRQVFPETSRHVVHCDYLETKVGSVFSNV